MSNRFLLYGATGFVGQFIAKEAIRQGLEPILAGRDANRLQEQADALGVPYRVAALDDSAGLDRALAEVPVVLHCAGPFLSTWQPMLDACLRTGTHYLDIAGEVPVLENIAARDGDACAKGVMLLPAVGFDVVATDCLALHLKQKLPSATRLALAFQSNGPAGMPPGTARTTLVMLPRGIMERSNGRLVSTAMKTRAIDFGSGPVTAHSLTWGDLVTAYHSTGIPNIQNYVVFPPEARQQLLLAFRLRALFRLATVRALVYRMMPAGATEEELERTHTHVWGEVADEEGRRVSARLHGPEAGAVWTARAALAAVGKVLSGDVEAGFQTPAKRYGPDFVLDCEGTMYEGMS